MQLEYAADDVRYLPAVWEEIRRRLEAGGHGAWVTAECEKLCRLESYAFDLEAQVGRVKGGSALSGRKLAVLRELVSVRDQAARQQDVPARSLLRDEVLVGLAKRQPTDIAQLKTFTGLPRPVEQAYGAALLEAVRQGQQSPALESASPRRPEPPSQRVAVDSLWALVQGLCHSQGVDPALVATRNEIHRVLESAREGKKMEGVSLFQGWREQLVGRFVAEFLQGKSSLTLRWEDGRLTR
jgi:ribonuclease D